MTDEADEGAQAAPLPWPYRYSLVVIVESGRVLVTGDGFHQLNELGININHLWADGFRGTIEIKGDMQ